MKLGVNLAVFGDRPLEAALEAAARAGLAAVEVPVHQGGPFADLERPFAEWMPPLRRALEARGLALSALDNHLDSQLVLGPHGAETEHVRAGAAPERSAWAQGRVRRTLDAAAELGCAVVTGFFGEAPGAHWFPWPDARAQERGFAELKRRWLPLLEHAQGAGVRFAHEPHPRQSAFDLETCRRALEVLDWHPAAAFNLDAGNLLLCGIAPEVFVAELGGRVAHLHAKDLERPAARRVRSGPMAGGPWDRPDRGFRFRVPGWGQVDWRALLSELHLAGYDGTISIEHEDPVFGREEGVEQAVSFLRPLLPQRPPEKPWW